MSKDLFDACAAMLHLPAGATLHPLTEPDCVPLAAALRAWCPQYLAGSARRYLHPAYYQQVLAGTLAGHQVALVRRDHVLSAVGIYQCDPDAGSLYMRLAAVDPAQRGAALGRVLLAVAEAIGRHSGFGLLYGMVDLKTPHAQRAAEQQGWRGIGIVPGLDTEMTGPGCVQRVMEAVYVKTLPTQAGMLAVQAANLTPANLQLMRSLFPEMMASAGPTVTDR